MSRKGAPERDAAIQALNSLGYSGGFEHDRDSGYGQSVRYFSVEGDDQVRQVLIHTRKQGPDVGRKNYWFGIAFKDLPKVDWVVLWVNEHSKLYLIPPIALKDLFDRSCAAGVVSTTQTQWLTDVDPIADVLWSQGSKDRKIDLGVYAKTAPWT